MAQYAFLMQKADRWRKDMASLWGNLNICHQLHWLELLCHSQVELSSLKQPQSWGEGQKSHHDITFLLVQVENAMGDRHYGLSIIWADPSQVRAASFEEAVGKLTACTSSGTNWPYTLVWLHKGTCHTPFPKDGHLGILPQRGAEATPCGEISQLEVCQLLAASPQVIYPHRFEWAGSACYNLPATAAGQWHKPYCRWTYQLGDWYPLTSSGGAGPKDTATWWGLHHHSSQSHKSPQNQKAAWLWTSGTSYPEQYWKCLAVGPNTCPQGGLPL